MIKVMMMGLCMFAAFGCSGKDVRTWSDEEIDTWYAESAWNGLSVKPDAAINKRLFVEQNLLNPEAWKAAYEFLSRGGFGDMEPPVYTLDDKGTYASISEYRTKDSGHFEAHRKYIDIQYLVKGREWIYITPLEPEKQRTVKAYDPEGDAELFDKETADKYLLTTDNFLVLFPCDGHKPSIRVDSNEIVKKVVIKIPFIE